MQRGKTTKFTRKRDNDKPRVKSLVFLGMTSDHLSFPGVRQFLLDVSGRNSRGGKKSKSLEDEEFKLNDSLLGKKNAAYGCLNKEQIRHGFVPSRMNKTKNNERC